MSANAERDLVARIAPTDPARALEVARRIGDPWFRCQALTFVAEQSPRGDVRRLLGEASKPRTEPALRTAS